MSDERAAITSLGKLAVGGVNRPPTETPPSRVLAEASQKVRSAGFLGTPLRHFIRRSQTTYALQRIGKGIPVQTAETQAHAITNQGKARALAPLTKTIIAEHHYSLKNPMRAYQ
jgi:hypothetical protein